MPQVEIVIGGRSFEVACQEGEEPFLRSAALMLDTEASSLSAHIGRMPEARMLLMAGLMLADKTAGLEDRVREADAKIEELNIRVAEGSARGSSVAERVEVPVIPAHVTDTLAEIAARAEALAAMVEERLG